MITTPQIMLTNPLGSQNLHDQGRSVPKAGVSEAPDEASVLKGAQPWLLQEAEGPGVLQDEATTAAAWGLHQRLYPCL